MCTVYNNKSLKIVLFIHMMNYKYVCTKYLLKVLTNDRLTMQRAVHFSIVAQLIVEKNVFQHFTLMYVNILNIT